MSDCNISIMYGAPEKMSGSVWAVRTDWAGVVGGVTSRGEHAPEDKLSGHNISYRIGDDESKVASTRAQILAEMGASGWPVIRAHQVHGADVTTVRAADYEKYDICPSGLSVGRADGLVTQEQRVVLNLAYADCTPVLLYCPDPLSVGVLHAGWRGTAAQIAINGIEAMIALGCQPANISALIGPAICAACYEVGSEVVEAMSSLPSFAHISSTWPANHVGLAELNRETLLWCGLSAGAIQLTGLCTKCGNVPMFSYRGSGGGMGLHGAFIAIA